jgi:hypothetical protein
LGVIALTAVVGWWCTRVPSSLGVVPPAGPALDAFIISQLKQEVADRQAWSKRTVGGHLCLEALLPRGVRERVYLVQYGREKLICSGSGVIDPLLRIVAASSPNEPMVQEASIVLSYFDDHRVTQAIRAGTVQVPIISLSYHFTYAIFTAGNADPLNALDREVVEQERDRQFSHGVNLMLLRWLNRAYDHDLDEWLAQAAPAALAFRKAQLEKGFDPAVALRRIAIPYIDERAIDALFPRQEDRDGCRQLFRVVYHDVLPSEQRVEALEPPVRSGWQDRLVAWYQENRPYFVYDFSKHRFVVRKPATATTSAPGSRSAATRGAS